MSRPSDKQRLIIYMLAGNEVRVTDWNGPETPDGGKPIMRVAARVLDLKKDGWHIERTGKHNACAVYGLFYGDPARRAA